MPVIGDGAMEETQTARGEEKRSVRRFGPLSRSVRRHDQSVRRQLQVSRDLAGNLISSKSTSYHTIPHSAPTTAPTDDRHRPSGNNILIPFQNKDDGGGKRVGL